MLYTNAYLIHQTQQVNLYWLYHSIMADGKLGISRSDDGDSSERVAILPVTLDCERNGIGASGCIRIGGLIHLFYQTYGNGKPDAICRAVSSDGRSFVKDETNPVFAPREWNASESGHPYIYTSDEGRLRLYYQGPPDTGKRWYLSRRELLFGRGIFPVV